MFSQIKFENFLLKSILTLFIFKKNIDNFTKKNFGLSKYVFDLF